MGWSREVVTKTAEAGSARVFLGLGVGGQGINGMNGISGMNEACIVCNVCMFV
jgi:hypothetical protein